MVAHGNFWKLQCIETKSFSLGCKYHSCDITSCISTFVCEAIDELFILIMVSKFNMEEGCLQELFKNHGRRIFQIQIACQLQDTN